MVCISCSKETGVINSRHQRRSNTVWRRRKCLSCKSVFTTNETAEYSALWAVTDKNGKLSPFSRDKLLISLYASLQHRPTAIRDAAGLTTTVITKLVPLAQDGLLTSSAIANTVEIALHRFDASARTHYQAFHKP